MIIDVNGAKSYMSWINLEMSSHFGGKLVVRVLLVENKFKYSTVWFDLVFCVLGQQGDLNPIC